MANADIDPPKEFVATHARFAALLTNTPISAEFAKQEAIATKAKAIYTALGVFSLSAAFITLTALIVSLTLAPALLAAPWAKIALGVVGALGVLAQVGLLAGPFQKRWLNARFSAERLRCLKFQALAHAACAGDDHETALQAFTAGALSDLKLETDASGAAMHEFEPERALQPRPAPRAPLAAEALVELKDIYTRLRVDYQSSFARAKIKALAEERKLPAAASEISFWGGAALAYVDAIVWAETPFTPLVHFLTLFLFVLSALLFVLERGRAHNTSIERYEDYRLALARAGARVTAAKDVAAFVEAIWEVELAALRELKAFCREADKSTYLF